MNILLFPVMVTLLVGCVSEDSSRSFPVNGVVDNGRTSPTRYRVSTWTGELPLRRYKDSTAIRYPAGIADVSGQYSDPMMATGGFHIHFYPDGIFKAVEWIDIAPSFLVAEGTWKLEDNIVTVSIAKEYRGWGPGMDFFREEHGDITKWHLFVTGDGDRIWDTVLLTEKALKNAPGEYRQYLERRTPYRNWKKERESFKTSKQWKKERKSNKDAHEPADAVHGK